MVISLPNIKDTVFLYKESHPLSALFMMTVERSRRQTMLSSFAVSVSFQFDSPV